MLVEYTCNICGGRGMMDLGNDSLEVFQERLETTQGINCNLNRNHVEIGRASQYYTLLPETLREGEAPTEERFEEDLRKQKKQIWSSEELREQFDVDSFSYGICIAINRETREKVYLDFTGSPKGKRFYYIMGS